MDPVIFQLPTRVVYGAGAIKQIGDQALALGIHRALLVTDKGIASSHLLDQVMPFLEAAKITTVLFDAVEANPSLETTEAALKLCLDEKCDGVFAVGGGSPLDVGKAVAVLATNSGNIREYLGIGKIKKDGLPIITIPTTAGTAAEITDVSVLSDHQMHSKVTIRSPQVAPRLALLDPALTLGLPPSVTRDTGMDALTHAIESFINVNAWPASEALALRAIEMIGANLRTAVYNGANLAARDAMLSASLIAGFAFHNTRLALVHAITTPLQGVFELPHGVCNAIVLPHALEFMLPGSIGKYIQIAQALGEPVGGLAPRAAAGRAIVAIRQLMDDIGVPRGLAAYNVTSDPFPAIAEKAAASFMIALSPRRAAAADIVEILRRSL